MNRPSIIIEKILSPIDDFIEYRIHLAFGNGNEYRGGFRVSRYEMEARSNAFASYLKDRIKDCAAHILIDALEPELDSLYRQTGDFDNSRALRELQEREAYERVMSMAQAARPRTATEMNMLNQLGNQRLNDYQQAMNQQMNQHLDAMRYQIDPGAFERFWQGEFEGTPKKPKQNTIDKKAMELLASKIGWRKMRQLKKKGYFEEQGKHGKFRFHLDKQGGVTLIERKKYGNTEREVEWSLCVQSMASDLPKGDVILSRWMEWKADEDKFLDTANFRSIKTRDEATAGRL